MAGINEDILDIPSVEKPPVNIPKSSTQQLKDTPLNSMNTEAVTRELLKREEQVMIQINSTERDKFAVPVGVNGRLYNIPRDIWVKVPKSVLGVLNNAKIMEYKVMADPKRGETPSVNHQEVSRFAVSSKPVEVPPAPAAGTKPPAR